MTFMLLALLYITSVVLDNVGEMAKIALNAICQKEFHYTVDVTYCISNKISQNHSDRYKTEHCNRAIFVLFPKITMSCRMYAKSGQPLLTYRDSSLLSIDLHSQVTTC